MTTENSSGPRHGVTVRAHVENTLRSAILALRGVQMDVEGQKVPKAKRAELSRDLAGVISECESVRLWLDAGCPVGRASSSSA